MSRPHPNQRPRVLTILILGGIFVFGFLFPYQKNNQGGVVFQTQSYQQEESTPPSLILDVDATTEDDSGSTVAKPNALKVWFKKLLHRDRNPQDSPNK